MNMQICNGCDCKDNWWPTIEPTDRVPRRLVTFQVSNAGEHKGDWCHFFIDDYRFERLWNNPERYVPVLKRYKGVLSPDFSTYTDMPYPMQIWNVYRSRALAHYWQQRGIEVIPTLQWSDEESWQFCFDGLPKGGTVAVSTVGVAKSMDASELFIRGCQEAWTRTQYRTLLMHGKRIDVGLPNNVKIRTYDNDNHARVLQNLRKDK